MLPMYTMHSLMNGQGLQWRIALLMHTVSMQLRTFSCMSMYAKRASDSHLQLTERPISIIHLANASPGSLC